MKIKTVLTLGTLFAGSVLLSACSQNVAEVAPPKEKVVVIKKIIIKKPIAAETTVNATADTHSHPKNECTNSVTHTHPNGKNAHKHHYSCKNSGKPGEVAHTHPANDCTREFSHAHPNARQGHVHDYRCNK